MNIQQLRVLSEENKDRRVRLHHVEGEKPFEVRIESKWQGFWTKGTGDLFWPNELAEAVTHFNALVDALHGSRPARHSGDNFPTPMEGKLTAVDCTEPDMSRITFNVQDLGPFTLGDYAQITMRGKR